MRGVCEFGLFLKELIKDSGMTQYEFYSKVGIKKPYFYDILSGRVNPPPPEIQFKIMEILNSDEKTREKFFDMAAKARHEIPADIVRGMSDNPELLTTIRKNLKEIAERR